jgi:LacI family transcriptional regulator, repressor for deo operon, udp, cdd, tsx, nupC, and nupG
MASEEVHTMEEFSEKIGLSRPTVSRFFNDPGSVRKSTRTKIEEGLKRYSYQPNFHASNLSRRRARAIGIIVPSIIDPFYSALVNTIEIFAEARGYLTILQCSHHDPAMEVHALERLTSMNVSGIAMASLGASTDIGAVRQAQARVNMVFMDSRLAENQPYIGTNNRQSVPTMVDYLCRSGTAPVFFGLPPLNFNIVERQQVYFDRMAQLGLTPSVINPDPIPVKDNFERFGFEQFMVLPRHKVPRGTTVLCVNDRVALGMMAAAVRLGLKVGKGPGDDLRVAGHDNQHFSRYTTPSLTTVAQDTQQIGLLAARALLEHDGDNDLNKSDQLIDGAILFRDSA